MSKIIGNTTATPNPRPDWAQTDETKADYIKNKPTILTENEIKQIITANGGTSGCKVLYEAPGVSTEGKVGQFAIDINMNELYICVYANDDDFEFRWNKVIPDTLLNTETSEEQTINSDIHILGRLIVDGEQTAVETKSLFVKDRFIVCNVSDDPLLKETAGFAILTSRGDVDLYYTYFRAYGIVHDQATDTVRLGRGVVRVKNEFADTHTDKLINPEFIFGTIEYDGVDTYIVHEEEGQAISTRENTITNGNIPQWDDTQKTFVDSDASVKDLFNASYGLQYSLNDDDTYTVWGIGTCTDTDLIIPSQYNGKKVTRIEECAFEGKEHITRVFIPKSISYVGYRAFFGCTQIEKIYIEAENTDEWEMDWDEYYIEETDDGPEFFYHKHAYKAFSNFMDVTDSLGDIDKALNAIIALQNSLIGGDA